MSKIRTRFAPAPSGTIHLGNIRAAVINLIFAKKHNGSFILRIEDTDKEKVTQEKIGALLQDLRWLGIVFDEGPGIEGPCTPYFQSQRNFVYQKMLQPFIANQQVYRCFCSKERLEELRQFQIANKQAPRYDRLCLSLPLEVVKQKVDAQEPFVWRFLVNHNQEVVLTDLIRGPLRFELKNFTDFVISRSDGNFNFLFANFADDVAMQITHIIRGEDHLSNGALQAILYHAAGLEVPKFIHLPLILNEDGQKLSKSAQNFDLNYLKDEGFLPEAICSYLACLGSNLEDGAYSISEMVASYNLDSISSQSVKYELSKILGINRKWMQRLSAEKLFCKLQDGGFLSGIPISDAVVKLINFCKNDCSTLKELAKTVTIFCSRFEIDQQIISLAQSFYSDKLRQLLVDFVNPSEEMTVSFLNDLISKHGLSKKEVFSFIRIACTGVSHGLTINQLFELLPSEEMATRIKLLLLVF